MKTADCPAGDCDTDEGPDLAGDNGPAAVDIRRYRGHPYNRINNEYADDKKPDCADFHIGAEIIAGAQKQPYGQHGGDEAINR